MSSSRARTAACCRRASGSRLIQPRSSYRVRVTPHLHRRKGKKRDEELRRPDPGLISHSDRGSQYTSLTYTDRLDELKIDPSVGSKGDAYDNAMAEAWVATFKSELVDGRRFSSFEYAEHEVLEWIGFYNDERLHEALGDIPPSEYEHFNIKRDNTRMLAAT